MNDRNWLNDKITDLIQKSQNEDFKSFITDKDVAIAKELIKTNAYSTVEFFVIISSINLLNAAIKRPEYKNLLTYAYIKGHISRILNYLISLNFNKYQIDFSINPDEKCAYVEIYNLQFSFHNFNINEKVKGFIESDRNKIKSWKGIRLQRIAGELYNLSIEYKEMSNKDK